MGTPWNATLPVKGAEPAQKKPAGTGFRKIDVTCRFLSVRVRSRSAGSLLKQSRAPLGGAHPSCLGVTVSVIFIPLTSWLPTGQ